MKAKTKKAIALAANVITLSGFCATDALAETFLFDDFEAQPVTTPGQTMQPPPIGTKYYYNPATSVEAVNVVTAPKPVKNTKSLETFRTDIGPDVSAVSTEGALINGNTLEIRWTHALSGGTGHRFNAPMQNSIGYTNGGVGQLAFITINDNAPQPAHAGEYHYSDAFTGQNFTGLLPSLDGFDTLRMVMTLQEYDPTYMTGTYDLFISLNGAPEVQVANDANLNYAEKATTTNDVGGPTSVMFRMQKGPFTSNSYYDNLSITDMGPAWNVNADGNWSVGSNWSPNTPANAAGSSARFGTIITAPRTVTLDAPQTVGHLIFDNTNRYTISGSPTLQLSAPTTATVTVLAGNHTIATPVSITSPTTAAISGGTTLTLSGPSITTDPGVTLTKVGAGRLELTHLRGEGLSVAAGTAAIIANGGSAGTSRLESLTVNTTAGAKLDLTNNKLVTTSPAGTWDGVSTYTGIAGLVDSARGSAGNAQWDGPGGITTTDTRAIDNGDLVSIGVATAAEARNIDSTATVTFAGQTVLGSDTLVMVTWGGDANLDGKINIDDYGRIDGNVGQSGTVFGWSKGDFNYDGKINIDDYGIIDGNINRQGVPFSTADVVVASGALDGVAAVPEPASLSLIALGATALLRRRRRNRRDAI
jgi:hypothetical protein